MTFEDEWARCAPWIEAALEHGGATHALEDIEALVRAREARFWAGREAAVVTEVQTWPRMKVLNVWLAGGDLAELRDELRPLVEAYGVAEGCQRMLVPGRQGWARALGYRPQFWICTKELTA